MRKTCSPPVSAVFNSRAVREICMCVSELLLVHLLSLLPLHAGDRWFFSVSVKEASCSSLSQTVIVLAGICEDGEYELDEVVAAKVKIFDGGRNEK